MNGENVQTVVDTNIETPRGLAIDLQGNYNIFN